VNPRWAATADLVVVGSGVAGLTAALRAVRLGLRVLVVTKAGAGDGNTRWAQGGVAVVTERDDSVASHVADTLTAGAGLCDERAVRAILAGGPAAVAALRRDGARFDLGADGLPARTREGGHSAFRVIHAGGDATGAEVERALLGAAAAVPVLQRHAALDVLLTDSGAVAGLAVLTGDGRVGELRAPAVLLATGGLGQLYLATTNPEVATGDGIALALRAGATVSDLEFVQFHPTVLFTGGGARGRRPLVTEAVRGEGAVLLDAAGDPFMAGVHPLADLAPRDVVAAAITRRMAATGTDHVYLDATGLGGPAFAARFPTVHAACLAAGIDPSTEPIPVAPAAHYSCGGVESTVDGRTAVPGLYAAGEVARTGLHGANRLASNSLLEGLVVGARAAEAVAADLAARVIAPGRTATRPTAERATADRDALQHAMSRHVGIGRDLAGLTAAATTVGRDLAGLTAAATTVDRSALARPAVGSTVAPSTVDGGESLVRTEDAALTLTASALLVSATARTESRGCHVRTDHPATDDRAWRHSLAVRLDDRGHPVPVEPARVAS
jgi:L-aspartate oxidase